MPFSTGAGRTAASGCSRRASRCITPATPLPESHRFPVSARLRAGSEFLAVRSNGRMVQGRFLRLSALQSAEGDMPRLGVVTSRRVGGAVERNRMRRRIREIFRTRRPSIKPGTWLVVTAKPGAGAAEFAEVREEWLRLANRLSIFRGS